MQRYPEGMAKIMSNTGMDIPAPIENRLVELEVKAGFAEDTLDQLNALVYRQQQQIDMLVRQLRELHQRMPEPAGGARAGDPRDERPPHY